MKPLAPSLACVSSACWRVWVGCTCSTSSPRPRARASRRSSRTSTYVHNNMASRADLYESSYEIVGHRYHLLTLPACPSDLPSFPSPAAARGYGWAGCEPPPLGGTRVYDATYPPPAARLGGTRGRSFRPETPRAFGPLGGRAQAFTLSEGGGGMGSFSALLRSKDQGGRGFFPASEPGPSGCVVKPHNGCTRVARWRSTRSCINSGRGIQCNITMVVRPLGEG